MKKDKHSDDVISEGTLHEILLDIKYRLDHLEDMEADNRALMIKMVKQSNSIVKFLAQVDLELSDKMDVKIDDFKLPSINKMDSEKFKSIKELVDEFMEKRKDLQELEEELEKHKDDINPGQSGEA